MHDRARHDVHPAVRHRKRAAGQIEFEPACEHLHVMREMPLERGESR